MHSFLRNLPLQLLFSFPLLHAAVEFARSKHGVAISVNFARSYFLLFCGKLVGTVRETANVWSLPPSHFRHAREEKKLRRIKVGSVNCAMFFHSLFLCVYVWQSKRGSSPSLLSRDTQQAREK